MAVSLSSPSFKNGMKIPSRFTCQGEDFSPALEWSGVPENALSLVLIMDDPDAPGSVFTHWVLFNLPPDKRGLPENVPPLFKFPDCSLHGKNDFGRIGYGGPCPPAGYPHNYRFTLYALSKRLEMSSGTSKQQVLDAAREHMLDSGRLIGSYQR